MRPLLSTKKEFTWTADHDIALITAKQHLSTSPVLAFFNVCQPTRLCTDASRQGLGFIVQQQSLTGQWMLVQAGSCFLSEAESRYAIIELEMLAVAWTANKCKTFLMGLQNFQVITDHNPLISLLNSHPLDEIDNPRLQQLKTKLMAFNLTVKWCKGGTNRAPDALSRYPVWKPHQSDPLAEFDEDNLLGLSAAEIRVIVNADNHSNIRTQDLRDHAKMDKVYMQLKKTILKGFPDHKNQLPEALRQYWQVCRELSIEDDLILYGYRLLIPTAMRKTILAHQGITRTSKELG